MLLLLRIGLVLLGICASLVAIASVIGAGLELVPLVAYTQFPPRNDVGDIFLIDVPRRLTVNATHHPANDYNPVWSPDGQQIVFVSDRDGKTELYLLRLDGSQSRLTNLDTDVSLPVWSPTGRWLLFTEREDESSVLAVLDLETETIRPLDRTQFAVGRATWSPDRPQVASPMIRIDDLDKTYIVILDVETGTTTTVLDGGGQNYDIHWSPDGQHLAFSSNLDGDQEIYVLRLSDQHLTQLTKDDNADNFPVWLPNSRELLYVSKATNTDQGIFLVNITDQSIRNVISTPDDVYPIGWLAQANSFLFTSNVGGVNDLYMVDAEGQNMRRLTFSTRNEWVGGFVIQPYPAP